MLRPLMGVLALSLVALASTFCDAKPPDLPENLVIELQATTSAPVIAVDDCPCHDACPCPDSGPCACPGSCPCPCPGSSPCPFMTCPDKHVRGTVSVLAERTVLENLERLVAASDLMEKAKKHAQAGQVGKVVECLARVHELAPGSAVEETCSDIAAEVVRRLFHCQKLPLTGSEEATEDEEQVPGCCCEAFVRQFGLCWLWQASKVCEEACASRAGKAVMVDGLMKSAHLALSEGRVCKARELVKQAHALDAARVEADPLVYKMGLLPMKDTLGGEQSCEPCPAQQKR